MIELRWVERGDGHDDDPLTRTLQYRELPQHGAPILKGDPRYQWKDIPVVNWREAK